MMERFTLGCLATTPGVRFEASECNCLENSESAPRAGCTDSTTWLEVYAILATAVPRINQSYVEQEHKDGDKVGQGNTYLLHQR